MAGAWELQTEFGCNGNGRWGGEYSIFLMIGTTWNETLLSG